MQAKISLDAWPTEIAQARAMQLELRDRVERTDRLPAIKSVAGVDVGFIDAGKTVRAAIAVLSFPGLQPLEQAVAQRPTTFPYVPGFLSFRELPGVLQAFAKLSKQPDLLLCDGHGFAHPRRFGIACHLGVLLDLPSIGVGKSRLIGQFKEPGPNKGDCSELRDKNETIGAVVRTRKQVLPIFISVGHRICLETAVRYALACTTKYKLPETTRAAHHLASGL